MLHCTRNKWYRPMLTRLIISLLTLFREQPRSTRAVVFAYPRPVVLSATKSANHAPISFDQQRQVHVSQGHNSCRNKEKCSTEVHDGGGLKCSTQPSKALCIFEKCPYNRVRLPLIVGSRKDKTDRGHKSGLLSEPPRFAGR